MKIEGGVLHLVSGAKIELPSEAAVEAVTAFWESIPKGDDVPVSVALTPAHEVVLVRSSIAAIERRGSAA
ncbi:MAG TPA: hypothetical protein VFZ56_05315 [Gemmatimonadaceae bacterium]